MRGFAPKRVRPGPCGQSANSFPVNPFRVAVNFKYGAEAFAMAGIAYGLIKWVGRNVRSLLTATRSFDRASCRPKTFSA